MSPDMLRFLWTDGIYGLSMGIIGVLFNLHLIALGYHSGAIAWITSINPLATTALSVLMGGFADRYGRKRILVIGTTLLAVGAVLQPLFVNFILISLSQLIFSVGQAMVGASEFAVVASYVSDEDRDFAISVIFANFMLMIGIGSILGGWLPQWLPRMHTQFESTLLLGGFIFCIAPFGRRKLSDVGQSLGAHAVRKGFLRPSRPVVLYSTFAFLSGLSYGFAMPYLNLILAGQFRPSVTGIGLIIAMNEFALFVGSFLTPFVLNRYTVHQVLGPLLFSAFVMNIGIALNASLIPFVTLLMLRSLVNMIYAPIIDSLALGVVMDAERAIMQSYRGLMRGVGMIFSVWLGGEFLTGKFYNWAFLTTGGTLFLMFVFYTFLLKKLSLHTENTI